MALLTHPIPTLRGWRYLYLYAPPSLPRLGRIHAVLVSSLGEMRGGQCGPRLPYISLTGVEWRGLE